MTGATIRKLLMNMHETVLQKKVKKNKRKPVISPLPFCGHRVNRSATDACVDIKDGFKDWQTHHDVKRATPNQRNKNRFPSRVWVCFMDTLLQRESESDWEGTAVSRLFKKLGVSNCAKVVPLSPSPQGAFVFSPRTPPCGMGVICSTHNLWFVLVCVCVWLFACASLLVSLALGSVKSEAKVPVIIIQIYNWSLVMLKPIYLWGCQRKYGMHNTAKWHIWHCSSGVVINICLCANCLH